MDMGGSSGTTNDLFVMLGSDFDRPGLLPRANYSISIGHMFGFLRKDPFGDELTFSYMYEIAGLMASCTPPSVNTPNPLGS
jgi:hypothetical protein